MTGKARKVRPAKWGPLTIDGDEYVVRLNPGIGSFARMQRIEQDMTDAVEAIAGCVKEHPWGREDNPDEPLPVAEWDPPLINAFIEAYANLITALPND